MFRRSVPFDKRCCRRACPLPLYGHFRMSFCRYGLARYRMQLALISSVCGFTLWKEFAIAGRYDRWRRFLKQATR